MGYGVCVDRKLEKISDFNIDEQKLLNDGDYHFQMKSIDEFVRRLNLKNSYLFGKRLFDVLFSLIVLVFFSWLFALIAILIFIDDPCGSPIFKQVRVGSNGKKFKMYKFRSMYIDAEDRLKELEKFNEKDGPAFKLANDPRVTRVGKFIRKTSLDELPQFINVLLGDISIVGPRPALVREVDRYSSYEKSRLLVKPGITCYWQTQRERDSISFNKWVNLDILYIRDGSIVTDLKLIIRTIVVVFSAEGH